jgi:SAM-dependent methyltransferase
VLLLAPLLLVRLRGREFAFDLGLGRPGSREVRAGGAALAHLRERDDEERDRDRDEDDDRQHAANPSEDLIAAGPWFNVAMTGVFHSDGESYDCFMGRYSMRLAPLFAEFAGVEEGQHVLDVGAGTGALTRELVARGAAVAAVEPSAEFTHALRARFIGIEVHEGAAEELPFADDTFDVALAQLVVAFLADAPAAMRELGRVARRVAICMWGVEEMEMFAAIGRTARALGAGEAESGARRYRTPQELYELLTGAGLREVETGELDVAAGYADYDEFWHTLTLQVGPAGAWLHGLGEEQRALARDEMFRQLGSPDGPFELHGRAYAARAARE